MLPCEQDTIEALYFPPFFWLKEKERCRVHTLRGGRKSIVGGVVEDDDVSCSLRWEQDDAKGRGV